MELVTVEQARAQIRVDDFDSAGGPDDAWFAIWIPAASALVRNYLKRAFNLYEWELDSHGDVIFDSADEPTVRIDSAGDPIVRPEVKAATLIYLAIMYRDRDGTEMEKWQQGYPPMPVVALLHQLRDPALR